ncbi:MAG: M20/M25/M40 family metallo-hydrolase [Treponema sp.]|nr:M20/M25/M40 family metallo-hydrolase [Treponema sp.]
MKNVYEELKTLSSISAISGCEDFLIRELKNRLSNSGADIHIDRLGNVTATFKGSACPETSIIYFAHMDELGLIVKAIDKNGFLRVERVGGIPERVLTSVCVDVHSLDYQKSYTGFFGTYSHHLTPPEKKLIVPEIKDMYIDIGCESSEEVLALGINVGSMVTYTPTCIQLGKNKVSGKALDDRVGVYILLCMAEHLKKSPPKATVHLCFTVQEEFNVRGSLPVFERLLPNAGICLDVAPTRDTPDLSGQGGVELGKGPAISYFNFHGRGTLGGLIPNPKLTAFIADSTSKLKIKCQHEVSLGVITDDAFTQLTGTEGVAMAHISLPCRYTHTPRETIDLRDLKEAIALCCETAAAFDSKLDLSRG